MTKLVHVIPHTHWDREWYFTTSRSKVYLLKDLGDVLDNLEKNSGYDRFVLDGQSSLIEDYLTWRPEDKPRIKQLVIDGKLILGPWYTQTDQFVISGESIVRNLQYGIDIADTLGGHMNIGYVPDSFGQESSMPQIYRGFGIHDTMFWRGVSDEDSHYNEFIWQGEDGTKVNVYQIPFGYYIGGIINEQHLATLMKEEPFASLVKRSKTNHIMFPNGFDQAPPRKDLPNVIEKLNTLNPKFHFVVSSIQEYVDAVKKEQPKLNVLSGELTNGKNMRIHKSIYSSRSDLKKMNTQIQFYLTNVLEPVLTIGEHYGVKYPKEAIHHLWKLMFENAAHDSIGSCVSDTTNEDIYMRYKKVRDISTNLVEITLRQVAVQIKKPNQYDVTLTLFNTLPYKRSRIVQAIVYVPDLNFSLVNRNDRKIPFVIERAVDESEYILAQTIRLDPSKNFYVPTHVYKATISINVKDLPSMGYEQLYIKKDHKTNERLTKAVQNSIENEFFKLTVERDGSLTIYDKEAQRIYTKQAVLEENGDDGDSFNYSPPRNDLILYSTQQKHTVNISQSSLVSNITIKFDFKVPKTLAERQQKKLTTKMPVIMHIRLSKGSRIINFSIDIDNRLPLDHRLCVDFATGISSKASFADLQFGTIQRPVYRTKEMALWKKSKENWNEKPITIDTCQSFAALSNDQQTVAVLPQGVREYEIIGDRYSIIRLTLFRSYGMMGKTDLLYRPGRASGEKVIATPAAELNKKLSFSFGLYIKETNFEQAKVTQIAKTFNSPIQPYEYADFLNGRLIFKLDDVEQQLADQGSILYASGDLTLSVLKKAHHRSGYIARFYNGSVANQEMVRLCFAKKPARVEIVDLLEHKLKALPLNNKSVMLSGIGHAKFISIYFEY